MIGLIAMGRLNGYNGINGMNEPTSYSIIGSKSSEAEKISFFVHTGKGSK
jgi:hypothetical protein